MGYRTKEELGRQLAVLRQRAGYTQRQLAEAIGIDASALSRIEAGQRSIAIEELVQASDFLGVSIDALLREKPLPFAAEDKSNDPDVREALTRMRSVIQTYEALT